MNRYMPFLLLSFLMLGLFACSEDKKNGGGAAGRDDGTGNIAGDGGSGNGGGIIVGENDCQNDDDCTGTEICSAQQCIEPDPQCENDADCGLQRECQQGQCVDVVEPVACVDDVDCGNGRQCQEGMCVVVQEDPDCVENADCGEGRRCEDNICVNENVPPECNNDPECGVDRQCRDNRCEEVENRCDDNSDCEGALVCRGGFCTPECEADNDCGENEACENQQCVSVNAPECEADNDCGENEICEDEQCVADLQNANLCEGGLQAGELCDYNDEQDQGVCKQENAMLYCRQCEDGSNPCSENFVCNAEGFCIEDVPPIQADEGCVGYCRDALAQCGDNVNAARLFNRNQNVDLPFDLETFDATDLCLSFCSQYRVFVPETERLQNVPDPNFNDTQECRFRSLQNVMDRGFNIGACASLSPNGGNTCFDQYDSRPDTNVEFNSDPSTWDPVSNVFDPFSRTHCAKYCWAMNENCQGTYAGYDECMTLCGLDLPETGRPLFEERNIGQWNSLSGSNTISCRTNYAYLAGAVQSLGGNADNYCQAASIEGHANACGVFTRPEIPRPSFEQTVWPIFQHRKCVNCHNFETNRVIEGDFGNKDHNNIGACGGCHSSNQSNDGAQDFPGPSIMGTQWRTPQGGIMDIDPDDALQTCETAKTQMEQLRVDNRNLGATLAEAMEHHLLEDVFILWAVDEIGNRPGRTNRVDADVDLANSWGERVHEWIDGGMLCE